MFEVLTITSTVVSVLLGVRDLNYEVEDCFEEEKGLAISLFLFLVSYSFSKYLLTIDFASLSILVIDLSLWERTELQVESLEALLDCLNDLLLVVDPKIDPKDLFTRDFLYFTEANDAFYL